MKVLVVEVRSKDEIEAIKSRNVRGYRYASIPRLSPRGSVRWPGVYLFTDNDTLCRIMLAPNKLAIIKTLMECKAISIRALAKRVERLYYAVYRDVQTLLEAGVIGIDDKGKLAFPYDEIRFNFSVNGAGISNAPQYG